MTFHERAVAAVKAMWRGYLLDNTADGMAPVIDALPESLVVIGTGKHEFYRSKAELTEGLARDRQEAQNVAFDILDEWYSAQAIAPNVCVVYGTLWVRERTHPDKAVHIEMDSRFSVVCHDSPSGVVIDHLHHSLPNADQQDGEYYPKTVSDLAEEALARAQRLQRRLELDAMTGLYNRVAGERHARQMLTQGPGTMLMIDLDDFKRINDTLGHLAGDEVILAFTQAMCGCFAADALLARMGGDEFMAFCPGESCQRAEGMGRALQARCAEVGRRFAIPFSCSIGLARGRAGEDFDELYRRADRALYLVKGADKGGCAWA